MTSEKVEGEAEGSLRGARKPRRDGRHLNKDQEAAMEGAAIGKAREADNRQDDVKNQKKKRALVCYNCGDKPHTARLCPTLPDRAAQAVDEEGDAYEESSETVTSWEGDASPRNKASGSVSQLWSCPQSCETQRNLQA